LTLGGLAEKVKVSAAHISQIEIRNIYKESELEEAATTEDISVV